MTVTNTIQQPFSHKDVQSIAQEIYNEGGNNNLKELVKTRIQEILGRENLPERVQTWIHRICLSFISPDIPQKPFHGKLGEPIDIRSL